jgi:hypothetical protein
MPPALRTYCRKDNAAKTGGITLKIVHVKTGRLIQARHQRRMFEHAIFMHAV